jgi:hypothetical protein
LQLKDLREGKVESQKLKVEGLTKQRRKGNPTQRRPDRVPEMLGAGRVDAVHTDLVETGRRVGEAAWRRTRGRIARGYQLVKWFAGNGEN